ncbi:AraC family transcriptional regulator ligand-binding domain-containing protein [Nocardia sp. CDC153]|uniref:AraC family transcriptional regulator ligand-binding domain-containing protein n=1 Tax=Nocardia sp. CDC153 TaxID=3112167 RepID=UPI002DB73D70|nr:AraC family transcriptional regulator ligand-binding domain-containing protein [Nocardia sp. CDC153]MEC3952630.1 AraC family transcriptional regulator ligand-binding domain-containing protein [Nocardia sp. CDC153]
MSEATDNVLLPQSALRHAVGAGLEPGLLARESGLPRWSLSGTEEYRVPSSGYLRTWEVIEHGLGDPDAASRIADQYVLGQVGLYDYLFSTAPTFGEGLAQCGPYLGAITTNFFFEPGLETEEEVTWEVTMINGDGRGRELAMQWGLAAIVQRGRLVTTAPVSPSRITFCQSAPRSHARMTETFGTQAIEFGAPVDTITFRKADLETPLHTADPRLAAILRDYATATQPVAPQRASLWTDHLAATISAALDDNSATVDRVAARMFMSRRSLQRRLAEHGTTWRAELDQVRRERYQRSTVNGPLARQDQTVLLGYKDQRSARRAVRRWNT